MYEIKTGINECIAMNEAYKKSGMCTSDVDMKANYVVKIARIKLFHGA
jgi:hypothetical protein